MVEVKSRGTTSVGINYITPFINTSRHLINTLYITGAVMVTDGIFFQDSNGTVIGLPTIRLLITQMPDQELFNFSESALRVCVDYELSPIFKEYVSLRGTLREGRSTKSIDIVKYVRLCLSG
jgi:hypothetical protein